jgi:endonuclease/exonuclease/phosphatase family metal-dependent hydrolase
VSELRAATWNLLHGRSLTHGQVRVDELTAGARLLDADVVALQEVDRHQDRSGGSHQTQVVAEATGAPSWLFVPAVWGEPGRSWDPVHPDDADQDDRAAYGIGLVSRLEVLEWDVLRFPPAPFGMPLLVPGQGMIKVDDEPRVAVSAVLAGPSGPFTAIGTHLSFVPGFNVRQLRQLVGWARTKPGPRLVLGDLNMPGRLPGWVSGWSQLARVATYPSWKPRVQFDHVLSDELGEDSVRARESLRLPVSDHNALAVTLRL